MRYCFTLIKTELLIAIFSFSFIKQIYVLLTGLLYNQLPGIQNRRELGHPRKLGQPWTLWLLLWEVRDGFTQLQIITLGVSCGWSSTAEDWMLLPGWCHFVVLPSRPSDSNVWLNDSPPCKFKLWELRKEAPKLAQHRGISGLAD